ncbi:hypothetical protein [Intestinibacter sp.]|uniref:hypothetical protein n=1 Tax=Intestinibacter sp. TaxID=1965304 RepID=UPI003F1786FD
MKTVDIKAGSVFAYKNYNIFKKLLYKLLNKSLKYNEFDFCPVPICDLEIDGDIDVFEPIKNYSSKEEIKAMKEYMDFFFSVSEYYNTSDSATNVCKIINTIRPNTIEDITEIANSKFYKKIV